MRIFRRPRDNFDDPSVTELMWGVPRREGHSDTDDPAAHSGVMQHAFEFGRDDRAICGFEPPKRTSRAYPESRPQLAVPGRHNPKCRKCELLAVSRVRGDQAVAVMDAAIRDGRDPETDEAQVAAEPSEQAAVAIDSEPSREAVSAPGADEEQKAEGGDSAGEEPAADYDQLAGAPVTDADERPDDNEPMDFDGLGGIREPGFHPRAQAERTRRRSVRRGGTVLVGPGRRSVVIEVPVSPDIAGIVANVEPEIQDVRVEAVTVGKDGTARVTLNRPAPDTVAVAWYIVSNPFRESA